MFRRILAIAAVVVAAAAVPVRAADPSLHEIYAAAESGKLDAAQEMMATVLKDHPESGKAHYVAAELDARQGRLGEARGQLQTAERLAPGLPFAKPDAVRALKSQLGEASGGGGGAGSPQPQQQRHGGGPSIGAIVGIGLVLAIIVILVMRRRNNSLPPAYPVGGGYGPGAGYGAAGGYPPPAQGGGIGSGIAGGLASGLAVGAGVVAGEALAHRLMGDGERDRLVERPAEYGDRDANANMGGSDFGVNDSSSWDDSSGSVGDSGSGDDWS